jgi:hypothetical protein
MPGRTAVPVFGVPPGTVLYGDYYLTCAMVSGVPTGWTVALAPQLQFTGSTGKALAPFIGDDKNVSDILVFSI